MQRAHPETKVHTETTGDLQAKLSKIQTKMTEAFLCSVSVGWTERSALRALREQLFVHKSDLIRAFQEFDPNKTGITLKKIK